VKKSENFLTPFSYTGKYFSVLRILGKYSPNYQPNVCRSDTYLSQEKHDKLMPCSRCIENQEPLHKQKWYNFA